MSNPNNIIRPAVLNNNPPPPLPNPPVQGTIELESLVTRIVTDVLTRNSRHASSNANDMLDQTINLNDGGNLSDLDKIPDVVRSIREFSGTPGEFNSWKKSVDRIMKVYEPIRGSPKYYGILSTIRNKITGHADTALESYNTPLNWTAIARCLSIHYSDKRDLTTLEYQMTTMVQGNNTVQEFYHNVYSHLSHILDKLACMDVGAEPMELLTKTYRDKALDTFIRGLKGDLPRLLAMREPTELPQALHLCLKLENQHFRSYHANQNHQTRNHNGAQSNPQRGQIQNQRGYKQPFHPQLSFTPQFRPNGPYVNIPQINPQMQYAQYPNNNGPFPRPLPPRPLPPKPQPKPEPMDIDQSMRTRNVNYMNRPAQNSLFGKRPPEQYNQDPNKHQRNFNIEEDDQPYYNQNLEDSAEIYENVEYSNEHYEDQQLQVEYEHTEHSDVHFLI